jgi:6-phosphogluconolactonase (cycloisomerase 2 family)
MRPTTPLRATAATILSLTLSLAAACTDRTDVTEPTRLTPSASVSAQAAPHRSGGVFTQTNDASANAVLAFDRAADGTLTPAGSFTTGGRGIGGTTDPLFSQYSVVLSVDRHYVFVVNAGSDDISVFRIQDSPRLNLVQTIAARGSRPVSIAVSGNRVYVLNQGSNTLTGFRFTAGQLEAVPSWTRALSANAAGAAEARFSRDGRLLAVTERVSATIDTYLVEGSGALSQAVPNPSNGAAPFGFDFTNTGRLVVSEAAPGTASGYTARANGTLEVRTASAPTLQRAPCWLVVTPDGHYAYTANAGSATLTGFAVSPSGQLSLLVPSGVSADLGAGAGPLDLDVSADGHFVYVLKAGAGTIGALARSSNGALTPLADTPAQAARSGQQGLAAY